MKGSHKDLETTVKIKALTIQEAIWGEMHLGIETYHERLDLAPLLKGLPEDRCQSARA